MLNLSFVLAQGEESLWEALIAHCLAEPALVAPLLQDIGAHVDPLEVVKRIPRGMRIEGLREKLVKIISDYHLHMSAPAPAVPHDPALVPPQRDNFACHDSDHANKTFVS